MTRLGSIEAGGTKFICSVADADLNTMASTQFPTTTPSQTLDQCIDFFSNNPIDALSIGSFGPIDCQPDSPTYGYITSTPKPGWQNTDFVGQLKAIFDIPIYFTTDVNASAYGEMTHTGKTNLVYYTIGTGIGGGALQKGQFIGGRSHLEMGHTFVKRHPDDLAFSGVCPFHHDCLEGLAAGPSLEARLAIKGEEIPQDHPVWDIQAYYIAQAAMQTTLLLAPDQIILGGGVMAQDHILDRIHTQFERLVNGYVNYPDISRYIIRTNIANNGSAMLGNYALAKAMLDGKL